MLSRSTSPSAGLFSRVSSISSLSRASKVPAASVFSCSTFLLFLSSSSCRSNALATCWSNFSSTLLYFSVLLRISPNLILHAAECAWRVVPRMTDVHPGHFAEYPCCSISFFVIKKLLGIDSWAISLSFLTSSSCLRIASSGTCNFANFSPSTLSSSSLVLHGTPVTSSMAFGFQRSSVDLLLTVLALKIPDLAPITISPVFPLTPRKTPWSHTESSFPRAPPPIGRVRH